MDLSEAIVTFAGHRRILVASDFDGTLSEIVPDADAAVPVPGASEALSALAEAPNVTVMLVSGRRLHDLRARFADLHESIITVGEHGSAWDEEGSAHPAVSALVEGLESMASSFEGARVEPKRSSVTLHLINVEGGHASVLRDAAVHYLENATAEFDPRPRVEVGRAVVEIPLTATTKADAVATVRRSTGAGAVLFFGDDVSDESVFESFRPGDVGIKIGTEPSVAPHRLAEPSHVVAILEQIAYLRQV